MWSYLLRRLLLAGVTLLTILLVSYTLLRLAPGEPARASLLGGDAPGNTGAASAEKGGLMVNRALREKLNLDKPILTGFALWLRGIVLHGDFGDSATVDPGRPVVDLIRERLPLTVALNVAAVLLTYLVAVPLGVCSAARAGSWGDRVGEIAVFILYSLPVMWVALLLQALFCEGGVWPIFPLRGGLPENALRLSIWELQWEILRSSLLPVLCLAYGGFAGLSRYARGSMLEVIHGDFVRTARAKGVPEYRILWGHVFPNGLIPLITLFGGLLPGLIAGSVIVEYVFNLPGMGTLSLASLTSRDYPLQMALFSFAGALTLAGLLIADLCYCAADPRVKL